MTTTVNRRARITKSAVAAAVMLSTTAGCTVAQEHATTTAPATTIATHTTDRLPTTRPREIRLDGLDPCDLLTKRQRSDLDIYESGEPATVETLGDAPGCDWILTGESSRLVAVTTEGIEARIGQGNPVTPVNGFPTIMVIPESPDSCDLLISIADGQYLAATFTAASSWISPSPCDGARRLAEAAMHTLGATSATTGSTPTSLEDTEPCGLLTEQDLDMLGKLGGPPLRRDLGTARSCNYNIDNHPLDIDLRTNVGLAGVNTAGPVTDYTVGGHQAKVWISSGGSCFVVLGVSPSSRVDITYITISTGEDPCALARRVAELVEPRLP